MNRKMTRKRAQILIEGAVNDAIQKVAFDANLHDKMGVDNPTAVNAAKRRRDLLEALQVVFGNPQQIDFLSKFSEDYDVEIHEGHDMKPFKEDK